MKPIVKATYLTGLLFFSSAASQAQEQTFRLSLGAATNFYDTRVQVDADEGDKNLPIDLEAQVDMDSEVSVGWLSGEWRFKPNHRLRLDYIPVTRTGKHQLADDIEFHNVTVLSGSNVQTELATTIYDLTYTYSLYQDERSELGLSLGLYISDIELQLDAQGEILTDSEGESEILLSYENRRGFTAPLPLAGLSYRRDLGERWRMDLGSRIWDIEIAGVESRFLSAKASLEYQLYPGISAGVAGSYFNINLVSDENRFNGEVDTAYSGVQLFLAGSF